VRKEGSASFLKKRRPAWGSKKLLLVGFDPEGATSRRSESFFGYFFFKKSNGFAYYD
jgi:hypothetical protein